MTDPDPEPNERYEYRIDVLEDDAATTYFTDSIDVTKPAFITFAPGYRQSKGEGRELKGQILTFPSHLVRKITHYVGA